MGSINLTVNLTTGGPAVGVRCQLYVCDSAACNSPTLTDVQVTDSNGHLSFSTAPFCSGPLPSGSPISFFVLMGSTTKSGIAQTDDNCNYTGFLFYRPPTAELVSITVTDQNTGQSSDGSTTLNTVAGHKLVVKGSITPAPASCTGCVNITVKGQTSGSIGKVGLGSLGPGNYLYGPAAVPSGVDSFGIQAVYTPTGDASILVPITVTSSITTYNCVNNQCQQDPNGPYTDSTCNNQCTPGTCQCGGTYPNCTPCCQCGGTYPNCNSCGGGCQMGTNCFSPNQCINNICSPPTGGGCGTCSSPDLCFNNTCYKNGYYYAAAAGFLALLLLTR